MKLFLRYSLLFVAVVLWAGGCSKPVMRWFYQSGFVADDYRYGDLYRLSNLPQFKEAPVTCDSPVLASDTANTHLYLIGDSFAEPQRIGQRDFPVSYYQYVHWDQQKSVQLDPAKRNVLVLESVERHFREHFRRSVNEFQVVADSSQRSAETTLPWGRQMFQQIQSKGIEERLETVLFSQDFFLWFKELKASINFNWFDRVPPTVGISRDRQHLFVDLDTDTTKHLNASFAPLSDAEVAMLVDSVNSTAEWFRGQGFAAVYLAVIPNKASIMDPGQGAYNHLIERVQQHPALRVPVIDIYSTYARNPQSVYALGDSHWNCTGRAYWLAAVNNRLK